MVHVFEVLKPQNTHTILIVQQTSNKLVSYLMIIFMY